MSEQEVIAAILKAKYFRLPVTKEEVAIIELATNHKACEEIAGNVREGIRTVDELRECGCGNCLGALQLLGEAI